MHFNRIFHYQPSILGCPPFYGYCKSATSSELYRRGKNLSPDETVSRAFQQRFAQIRPICHPLRCISLWPSARFFFILSGGWHEVVPDQVRRHPLELMASGEIEWRERSLARKSRGGSCWTVRRGLSTWQLYGHFLSIVSSSHIAVFGMKARFDVQSSTTLCLLYRRLPCWLFLKLAVVFFWVRRFLCVK